MVERTLTVIDPAGLHARPAARFVQIANRFTSRITIRQAEREADAKSLIALLGLTVRPGSVISIDAEGSDAIEAMAALLDELTPFVSQAPASGAANKPLE
jgi:phosphotransferase system HPr (HPr) family protein